MKFARKYPRFLPDLLCVLLLISSSLAVGLPRYRVGLDWADEGFLAYGAVRVMEGQLPNRDFVSLQPPLSFHVAAAAFKLFGTSLASLRNLGLSIHVLLPLLVYAAARKLMKPAFALAAALPGTILGIPFFGFVPFAVWQGITVAFAATVLYMQALYGGRRWLALPAGMLTAVSTFLRHDQGFYLAILILILSLALWLRKGASPPAGDVKRAFVLWLLGAAMVTLGLTIYWWARNALPAMFEQLVVFPLTTYAKTSSFPFPHLSSKQPASENALTLLFYAPPLLESGAAIWLIWRIVQRGFRAKEASLAFLIAWSALFYCQVLTRSDLNHLLITLPPFFILAAYCWSLLLEELGKSLKIFAGVIPTIAMVWFLWTVGPAIMSKITKANETLALNRGGVRIPNARWVADFVRGVQAYVPPDRPILALPYEAMFYFLCERRNPTHWNYLWPGDQSARDHEILVQQAKRDPPSVVFLTNEKDMLSYAPTILDYVHAEYRQVGNFDRLTVYFPRGPTP